MQPGFRTHEELKDYISSTKSQILGSWEYRRILDVRYILQRLTIRCSISFLRQKARAQKARRMGLSGLLASFPYINFAHLIGQIYVFFRVLNDAFHRGKKSGFIHVVARGGGGKRTPFCRRKAIKSGSAHTHNMKESQDNTADSVGLMSSSFPGLPFFYSWLIASSSAVLTLAQSSSASSVSLLQPIEDVALSFLIGPISG